MFKHTLIVVLLILSLAGCATEIAPTATPAPLPTVPATVAPTQIETPPPEAGDSTAVSAEQELIFGFAGESETNGDLLILFGQVVDPNGNAVPDATVEIWQTDNDGVYDHPDDPTTTARDMSFQFYGADVSDDEGWYVFRTILPGEYEPRPRHIHFKVKQNGETVLTSQFYFSDSAETYALSDAILNTSLDTTLSLMMVDDLMVANGRIVIDNGAGAGSLPLTQRDAEGPFYPVVAVAEFDNDLTILD